MPDRLLSARGAGGAVSLVSAVTSDLVAEVRERHDLAPTASAAVGRLVTAAVMFGASLKARERVSLQITGDGPIGGIGADAWLLGDDRIGARAYAKNPAADLPLNERGKFDVAGVVGAGTLGVTLSYEVGQPYTGIVPLASGEIGDDIAAYLSQSQQIPSVVALGVLAAPDGIRVAGGVIAQLLPGADERTIAILEERAGTMAPVTTQIAMGGGPEELMRTLLGDRLELKITQSYDVVFDCRCTNEKVETALMGLGRDELERMARDPQTEATCDFCGRRFILSAEDVTRLAARLNAN